MTTKKQSKAESQFNVAVTTNYGLTSKYGYKGKNGNVSYRLLRDISSASALINICKETLKHVVVKINWSIHPKDLKMDPDDYKDEIEYLTNLIEYPNPQETFRTFWLKILDDVFDIDRGAIEIVRNGKGFPVQMWQVDGATIKPCYDEYGLFKDPAYIQLIDGEAEAQAEFEEGEMVVLMNSPLGATDMIGFGKSPVERILLTVLTSLNADNFNAAVFTKNSLPPFMINLVGATKEQVDQFRLQWENMTQNNTSKGIFTNTENFMIQKLRESNQEMQYYELSLWLAKMIIAAFEMSPQDLGLTMDVNRSSSETQQNISKNQGLKNILNIITEFFNCQFREMRMLNAKIGDLVFEFEELDALDNKTIADIDKIYIDAATAISTEMGKQVLDEIRVRDGKDPLEGVVTPPIAQQPAISEPVSDTANETSKDPQPTKEDVQSEEKVQEEDVQKSQKDKFVMWYEKLI